MYIVCISLSSDVLLYANSLSDFTMAIFRTIKEQEGMREKIHMFCQLALY